MKYIAKINPESGYALTWEFTQKPNLEINVSENIVIGNLQEVLELTGININGVCTTYYLKPIPNLLKEYVKQQDLTIIV